MQKWFVYTRGTVHPHRLSMAVFSVRDMGEKLIKVPTDSIFYFNRGPKLWWAWNYKQIHAVGRYLLGRIKTKSSADKHFKRFKSWADKAIKASEKIRKTNLKELSNQEIIDLYNYLYKEQAAAQGIMDPGIDAVDIVYEDFLIKQIKKETSYNFEIEKLTHPAHQTYISELQIDVIKAALKKKVASKDIDKLYNKYWWVKLGWEEVRPYTKEYFVKQIKKYKKQKNLYQKLAELKNRVSEIKKQRRQIIKKYKLSKKIEHFLYVLDRYTYLHDLRKEMQVRTLYAAHLLLLETARRFKLKEADLEWLLHDEMKELLADGKCDVAEIRRRKKAICIITYKNKYKLWSGADAEEQYKKHIPEEKEERKELKGTGVTKGKATAKVKICSGGQEANKRIKKGDILVCGMTLPDYVPAMKRAAAIITDEGGITCHAAIVSRELGKPCVVGTKVATQVLKDGDKVEVDANKGIIKKL